MALSVVPFSREGPQEIRKGTWQLYGHDDEVLSGCALGRVFATCSADGVVLVWRCGENGANNVCKVSSGGPATLDVSFASPVHLLCAQGDGAVALWSVETGKRLHSFSRVKTQGRNPWPVLNAVVAPDDNSFFSGGDDGYLLRGDVRARSTTAVNLHVPITALGAGNEAVFVGDACGHVRWLDLRMSGRQVADFPCGSDAISSVSTDAKGDKLTTFSLDGVAHMLDVQPFALSEKDRFLCSSSFDSGEPQTLLRGDWSRSLDVVLLPTSGGLVQCVSGSDFSSGSFRTLHPVNGGQKEEVTTSIAMFVNDSTMVVCGGSTELTLRAW